MKKENTVKNKKEKSNHNQLNKYSLIIGIFAVIVLIKIVLTLSLHSPYFIPDEIAYNSLAENIANGHITPKIAISAGPGYPIILSIAYLISQDKEIAYHIMLIISAIVSTSIIFPAYFILRRYCADIVSLLGAIAVTLLTFVFYYGFSLMTENLFTPLFLFSMWFLLESFSSDDKKWQVLASAAIVYLFITRSNAVAMILGLFAAFAYYLMVSSKKGLINAFIQKSLLIITFVILLVSWQIFSLDSTKSVVFAIAMAIIGVAACYASYWLMERKSDSITTLLKDRRTLAIGSFLVVVAVIVVSGYFLIIEKGAVVMDFGSAYPAESIALSVFKIFTSAQDLLIGSILFIDEIIYVLVCSFFTLTAVLFYLIFYKQKTYKKDNPLTIGVVYLIVTWLVLALTVVALRFYTNENLFMMGRYVESIIPAIVVLCIIYVNDMKSVGNKLLSYFIGMFIGLFVISLFLLEYDYSIIYGFNEYGNNIGLMYLEPLYHLPIPELWVLAYALVFMFLIYLSIKDKRYVSIMLIFVIISSFIPFVSLYNDARSMSQFRMDNSIDQFLDKNTNKDTRLYIDSNMTSILQKAALSVYAFWNDGYTDYIYANDTDAAQRVMGNNFYVISENELPYKYITSDDRYKLYALQSQ